MTDILAKGTATITAGNTSVVKAHDLDTTPNVEAFFQIIRASKK